MSLDPNLRSSMINKEEVEIKNEELEINLRNKKMFDEKIMDNILKINIALFIICLVIIGVFFYFDFEIVNLISVKKGGTYIIINLSKYLNYKFNKLPINP